MAERAADEVLLDVSDILHATADSIHQDVDVSLGALAVGPTDFTPRGLVHVDVTLTNAGTAIVATGSVDATLTTTCVRCLGELDIPVHGELEGFYVGHGTEHDLPDEQDYEFIEGATVDIMPAIRSALIVELPFAPTHPAGCVAACPRCGEPQDECSCDRSSESPFSVLRDLFPEDRS
ncbi:MAG: DUF177 domain-containing protein [Anaerosomatales bacterium]|nr:DUF177 domain-containing protein [Anaerosomatales bacterium]